MLAAIDDGLLLLVFLRRVPQKTWGMAGGRMEDDGWIGRQETAAGVLTRDLLARFAATLDRPPPGGDADLPPLAHWLAFLPRARQSELGADGHPRRGGFLPPLAHLPRRMWAGSRIAFAGALPVGRPIARTSTVESVARKQGRAGELVFVTVRHELGAPGAAAAIVDRHEIVYRGPAGAGGASGALPGGARAERGAWHRALVPDATLLFRYSALTFNGHRIHYDRPYATGVEGYPGLVVHGPLTATLLVDLVQREMPGARIGAFAFRAMAPVFDGNPLHLNGTPPGVDGEVSLWAADHRGRLAMRATARVVS